MSSPEQFQRPPLWYRDAVIYEVHVRAFADSNGDGIGDFVGLTGRLDYLQRLGITAIWLLPFYVSPLRDDGYDIADYCAVHPNYGTLDDFKHFLDEAHARGMYVITELVINHTSDQHPWFKRARRAEPGTPERDFYVWSDTDDRYPKVRIIFQDNETSNWAWDPLANAFYWHRFFSHQPDLNWENPLVREAVIEALDFWLDLGVDGLRLDAIPYLHVREGGNGENLPETHEELRLLRSHVDDRYGDRMLLAEANQWPEDSIAYFGDADECHMAFHFPLMPRLYLALEQESRLPIIDIMEQTPELPAGAQWAIFLRNHDELTLEMVTEEERDLMWRAYAPDRRARLNLGIRRRLAPLLENDRRRIELLMSLLLSLPGTPVLYYGDEIGMGDNISLADRDGVRTPMQWNKQRNAGFSGAKSQSLYLPLIADGQFHYETVNVDTQDRNPTSLLSWLRRMIRLRQRHPVFGRGTIRFLEPDNTQVLAYLREGEGETILVVANLSRHAQSVALDLSDSAGSRLVELRGNTEFPEIDDRPYPFTLSPYGTFWFSIESIGDDTTERREPIRLPGLLDTFVDADGELADRLARYAMDQVWYRGRGRRLLDCSITDVVPLAANERCEVAIALLRIGYTSGHPQHYVMPVGVSFGDRADVPTDAIITAVVRNGATGVLFDALLDPGTRSTLLPAAASEGTIQGRAGSLRWSAAGAVIESADQAFTITETERGESLIRHNSGLTLKLLRTIEPGTNPDIELRRFLMERTGFTKLPTILGSITYRPEDELDESTIGVVEQSFAAGPTAWEMFHKLCTAYLAELPDTPDLGPAPRTEWTSRSTAPQELITPATRRAMEWAAQLGVTTAELHVALAKDHDEPELSPMPFTTLYQHSLYQSLRATIRQEFATMRQNLATAPDEARPIIADLLAAEATMINLVDPVRRHPITAHRIRIHGDYRLDRMQLVGESFHLLDFSGDHTRAMSERRLKASPLRDTAVMLCSFDYVSTVAARETGKESAANQAAWWHRMVGERFVDAYLEASAGSPALPTSRDDIDLLLDAFELTEALRDIGWELANRPEWLVTSLPGVLRHLP